MSEETLLESAAPPEIQAKAEKLGWMPPARYKGDPERFVDAETYLERGETVLPIVKEQNKRLHAELEALKAESSRTSAALKNATEAIEQIEERHSVSTQKAVEEARRQLKVELASASEDGRHRDVAELTDQLTQLNDSEKEAKKEAKAPPPSFTPPPDLVEWNAENPWFGQNKRKTALALAVAQEMREAGDTRQGRTFYEAVTVEVESVLGDKKSAPSGDKVEGGRNGEENPGPRGKGFASLPTDARAACDADARKFVGPGKRYKTQAEWRSRYAEIYFGE